VETSVLDDAPEHEYASGDRGLTQPTNGSLDFCLRQGVLCHALRTPDVNIEERGIGVTFVPNLKPFSMTEREPSLLHLFVIFHH